jgi:predicted metalloenzyme YecM
MALTRSQERAISAGILRSGRTVSAAMVDVMYLPYPPGKQHVEENGRHVRINTN